LVETSARVGMISKSLLNCESTVRMPKPSTPSTAVRGRMSPPPPFGVILPASMLFPGRSPISTAHAGMRPASTSDPPAPNPLLAGFLRACRMIAAYVILLLHISPTSAQVGPVPHRRSPPLTQRNADRPTPRLEPKFLDQPARLALRSRHAIVLRSCPMSQESR